MNILFTIVYSITLILGNYKEIQTKEPKISRKLKIVNMVVEDEPDKLPIVNLTLYNKKKESIIINRITLSLLTVKKKPLSSSSNNDLPSHILTAIAGYDLELQNQENDYDYKLISPIEIAGRDAASFKIRLFSKIGRKIVNPHQIAFYTFRLTLLTYDDTKISTSNIDIR